MRKKLLAPLAVATLMLAFGASSALANHSWNGYHWARATTSTTLALKTGDNLTTAAWTSSLSGAVADWSSSSVIDLVPVAGSSRGRCKPTSGRIEACNDRYGNNGWLGIAQIWLSGGHIVQGVTKVNDTYFDTPTYNTSAWRNLVMCQEVAHDFGLDHQDENFSNPNLGTCMDYTNDPSTNQHPNAHDYEQIEQIYNHGDGFNSFNLNVSAPGSSGAHVVWLTPNHSVEYLGAGFEIHTHVFWTEGRQHPEH